MRTSYHTDARPACQFSRADRLTTPVGAGNPVTAADLVALRRTRALELGIWLCMGLTLGHCQYPFHYGSPSSPT